MATQGVAFAVLLGLDGSAPWRVVRVVVVIVVTALAVWLAGKTATVLLARSVRAKMAQARVVRWDGWECEAFRPGLTVPWRTPVRWPAKYT